LNSFYDIANYGYNVYNVINILKAMMERSRCGTPYRELEIGGNLTGNCTERDS
jgi:hypothetical protein